MVYVILIKTKDFVDKFIKEEIKLFTKNKVKTIEKGLYEISFKDEKELFELVYSLVYYSRLIENILLKIGEFKSVEFLNSHLIDLDFLEKNLTFKVNSHFLKNIDHKLANKKIGSEILGATSNLLVELDNPDITFLPLFAKKINYLTIDLVGFNLTKRNYKLNSNLNSINSLVPNYVGYLLGLNKLDKYIVLDPIAELGDVIIEISQFFPRNPLNIQKRHDLVIKKIFNFIPKLVMSEKTKNKFVGIVQDNNTFKKFKENLIYSGQKIKLSQYDAEWLDVKYEDSQIDYIISNFTHTHNENDYNHFQKEFFYQAEFICKNKIGIITKKEINKEYLKKNKLKIKSFEEIFVGEQKYLIYIIK